VVAKLVEQDTPALAPELLASASLETTSAPVVGALAPHASGTSIGHRSTAPSAAPSSEVASSESLAIAAFDAALDGNAEIVESAVAEPLRESADGPSEHAAVRLPESADATSAPRALRELEARPTDRTPAPEAPHAPKEPPVSSDRAADVLRQIRLQLTPEMRQATIQLEPRELGRISIRIAMRGDAVHAELRVERKATLEALERQVPELRAALDRSGLGGGELALQLGLGERHARSGTSESGARANRSSRDFAGASTASEPLAAALSRRLPNSGIDTYA
jgi:hypothetical protein